MSGDKYADELSKKYLGCMREIKHRTDVIQRFLRQEWHAGISGVYCRVHCPPIQKDAGTHCVGVVGGQS